MSTFKVQVSHLRCKNNCGFYGNPSWDGYCSVCYRETYIQQGTSRSISANLSAASTQAISLFDTKRKQLSFKGVNTIKSIFRTTKDNIHDRSLTLSEECYVAANEFNSFLTTLKASVNADASQMVTKLLDELETMRGSHINQYSVAIQNFYQAVSQRISKSTLYSNLPANVREQLVNSMERFVTTWIYCWAFASPITDDEAVDLKLQEKIRSLHWVTPKMLDSPINPDIPSEMSTLEAATMALIKVNVAYASEDKLSCIAQCCQLIFAALKNHYQTAHSHLSSSTVESSVIHPSKAATSTDVEQETVANADDFLPTLIWLIISANPPLLHSNLQFIMRFANQKRLNSGQAAYFFTNLSCAVHFLKNLTHKSLNMSEKQFYRCMRTGLPFDPDDAEKSEGEKWIRDNEFRLFELKEKIAELEHATMTSLENEVVEFEKSSKGKIEQLQASIRTRPISNKLDPWHFSVPLTLSFNSRDNWEKFDSVDHAESHVTDVDSLLNLKADDLMTDALPKPIRPSPYIPKSD